MDNLTVKGQFKNQLWKKYIKDYGYKEFCQKVNEIIPSKAGKRKLTAIEVRKVIHTLGYWEVPLDETLIF